MIDVDVSYPEAGDPALREAIVRAAGSTPVLLPRGIGNAGLQATRQPTSFDDLNAITWVSVRFLTDDARVVTRWRLWEPVCHPGDGIALPSPQLYLTLFSRDSDAAAEKRKDAYRRAAEAFCTGKAAVPGEVVSSDPARMIYAFGDVSASVLASTTARQNGAAVPALFRVSAATLLEKQMAPGTIRDRVVVIGASHADSRDIHMTPYGAMPGMLVVANAIAMGPAIILRPSMGPIATTIGSVVLAVASAMIFLRFRFVFFFILSSILAIALYAVIAAVYQPSAAAEVVTGALAILAGLLGFESLWETAVAWRRGCGFRSIFKDEEA